MSTFSLALTHTRYNLIETARVPMAVIGAVVFPTLAFCFFVLPQSAVVGNADFALAALISLTVFAVMSSGLFAFGLDLAERRQHAWDPYLRSLPGSPAARLIGMIGAVLVISLVAMVPLAVVAFSFTAARVDLLAALAAVAVALLTSIPTALLGVIIGVTVPFKGAIAVTQVAMFLLAFAGGLFLPPMMFPGWLDTASMFLPVRQSRDLVIAVASGGAVPLWALLGIVAWTLVLGAIAAVLVRRDEGRRFR